MNTPTYFKPFASDQALAKAARACRCCSRVADKPEDKHGRCKACRYCRPKSTGSGWTRSAKKCPRRTCSRMGMRVRRKVVAL